MGLTHRGQRPSWGYAGGATTTRLVGVVEGNYLTSVRHTSQAGADIMGSSAVKAYARALAELVSWMPIWPHGSPVEVGSVGTIADETFIPMGTAADAGLEFPPPESVGGNTSRWPTGTQ